MNYFKIQKNFFTINKIFNFEQVNKSKLDDIIDYKKKKTF